MPACTDAYQQLLALSREASLLGATSALLAWDQETYMPGGAGERRAEQLELMATLGHERATDARIGEWLTNCTGGDDEQQAAVREMQRDYDRATRLPTALVAELAATESRAQQAWGTARAASDFA